MDCGLEGKTFVKPSLCKPQFAIDCDLSNIIKRFLKTGQLPQMSQRKPLEGDFTDVGDFASIQEHCAKIRQQFDLLPIEVRNKFNNDPVAWVSSVIKNNPHLEPKVEPKPEPKDDPKDEPKPEPKDDPKPDPES